MQLEDRVREDAGMKVQHQQQHYFTIIQHFENFHSMMMYKLLEVINQKLFSRAIVAHHKI